jgi:tetrahydromethanopterin S-methyltransferase subunit G
MSQRIRKTVIRTALCAATVAGALAAGAAARAFAATPQPQAAPAGGDVLPALLEEVRGLRAAMEQMASAGPRIQLFVARLQLEETRINNMVHRLDSVRESLADAQREADQRTAQQQNADRHLNEEVNPDRRRELTEVLEQFKREAADKRALVVRLTGEEAQLAQDVGAEQARWTAISTRLDELEKSLSKR